MHLPKHLRNLARSLRKEPLYSSIPNDEVIEKQRFVVFRIFSLIAILVCVSVASKMLLTLGMINWLPFTILLLALIILVNYALVRKRERLMRAYVIMMVSSLMLLHLVSYTCGGIRTGGTFFMTAVLIYSFMLLGTRGGWLMSLAAGIHIVYLFLISSYTDLTSFSLFQERVDLINEDFLINILLTFSMIAALSSYLQSGRNVVIQRIVQAKKELEESNRLLQRNNAALEKKNAELDKFASVASHDLRAPLRAIGSLTDMVLEDDSELCFDTREKLTIIRGRVHRMDHLLSALLEYSRADRKLQEVAQIDAKALCMGLMAKHSALRPVQFYLPENSVSFKTSPAKLERVLDVLLSNAVRFNDKAKAEVHIDFQLRRNNEFIFSVSDNGPGIEAAFQEKVFVIFQTLEARDKLESTGAGLAIARKLVDDNGGEIFLEPNENGGCRFVFTWKSEQAQSAVIKPLKSSIAQTA